MVRPRLGYSPLSPGALPRAAPWAATGAATFASSTKPPPGMDLALDLAILATAWAHVFLAPYTKVEESFNLHAVHDVLVHGIRPDAVQNVRWRLQSAGQISF